MGTKIGCSLVIPLVLSTRYIEVQAGTEGVNFSFKAQTFWIFFVRNKQIETVVLVFFGNYIAMDNYSADHLAGSIGPARDFNESKGNGGP